MSAATSLAIVAVWLAMLFAYSAFLARSARF
jgi:hypothetical protein